MAGNDGHYEDESGDGWGAPFLKNPPGHQGSPKILAEGTRKNDDFLVMSNIPGINRAMALANMFYKCDKFGLKSRKAHLIYLNRAWVAVNGQRADEILQALTDLLRFSDNEKRKGKRNNDTERIPDRAEAKR